MVVKKELEERKMTKREQEDILRKNMFLAGYQLREYEFEVITELKIRESDGELKYFVIWDVRGSWHIEAQLGPSIKEKCLKLRGWHSRKKLRRRLHDSNDFFKIHNFFSFMAFKLFLFSKKIHQNNVSF